MVVIAIPPARNSKSCDEERNARQANTKQPLLENSQCVHSFVTARVGVSPAMRTRAGSIVATEGNVSRDARCAGGRGPDARPRIAVEERARATDARSHGHPNA
jgi:hypothetical protein